MLGLFVAQEEQFLLQLGWECCSSIQEGEKQKFPQFLISSSSRRIARKEAGQGPAPSRAGISWNFPPGLSRQVGKAGIWDPACPCHPPQNLAWGLEPLLGSLSSTGGCDPTQNSFFQGKFTISGKVEQGLGWVCVPGGF